MRCRSYGWGKVGAGAAAGMHPRILGCEGIDWRSNRRARPRGEYNPVRRETVAD